MTQKKNINFGFRGWMVLLYQFFALAMYCCINQFGQNIHASMNQMYGWNYTMVSTIYTIASVVAVVIQFIIGKKIANSGKLKVISIVCMLISAVAVVGMCLVTTSEALWLLVWAIAVFFSIVGSTFIVSTIVGQWFPRRKGTVMGIATLAFPVVSGIGLTIFGNMLAANFGSLIAAWIPWLVMDVVAVLICIFFIKEYPEQCGAYPDNDKSMTPEVAKAIVEKEIEAKKNSVWGIKNMFRTADFWLITIPLGLFLLVSVGAMTQVMVLLAQFGYVVDNSPTATGAVLLLVFAAVGCIGSWVLGIIDTKFGTKIAVIISSIFMVISGILCLFGTLNHTAALFIAGFACLQIFLGASSNFTVSAAAQYWRREDFPSAFSYINPLANLICALGPIMVAGIGFSAGFHIVWIIVVALGVIGLILALLFKPQRILAKDRKYRVEAGLPEEGISKANAEIINEK